MNIFYVSQEVVTPESAENGDVESCEMVADNCNLSLALSYLIDSRTAQCHVSDVTFSDDGIAMTFEEHVTGASVTNRLSWDWRRVTAPSIDRIKRASRKHLGYAQ